MKALLLASDGQAASVASFCASIGAGIEVQAYRDSALLCGDADALSKYRAAIAPAGLRAVHGPFADLCPGSSDPLVRDLARHRFEAAYRLAQGLDATHLVFHHGYVPGTSFPSRWLARSREFWKGLLRVAPPEVQCHLENHLERDPELLADLLAAVDDPRLDACLDVGHVHCHSSVPIIPWIERLGPRIGHVHLHDNHGADDEHLGLGEGSIPLVEVGQALEAYAPQALWTLEMPPVAFEASLRWLQGREWFPPATAPLPLGDSAARPRLPITDVSLRPYRREDVTALVEAARESVAEMFPFMPWCHPALTAQEQEPWIDRQVAAFAARKELEFAIVTTAGQFLGGCGINHIDPVDRRANVGYWVRSSATGRGVATAALRQLVGWAFTHTDLVRLEVVVSTQNAPSLRVAENAGALWEGVLRKRIALHGSWHDAVLFSFVRRGT